MDVKKYAKEIIGVAISLSLAVFLQISIGQVQTPLSDFTWKKAFLQFVWQGGLFSYTVIASLTTAITLILLRIKSHSRCPYFETTPHTNDISLTLNGIIKDIGGLYEDLQDTHVPLGNRSLREKIKVLRADPMPTIPALVFIVNGCSTSEYARIATKLDSLARDSILSVNTSLPSELFNHGATEFVIKHLNIVNNTKRLKGTKRQRIQVLWSGESQPEDCPEGIPKDEDFKEELRDSKLGQLWGTYFQAVDKGVVYKEFYWNRDITSRVFLGDFVLYDKELILLYDYSTRKLYIVFGKKVGILFAEIFEDNF